MQQMNKELQFGRVYFETPAGTDGDYAVIDVLAIGECQAVELAGRISDDSPWMKEHGYKSLSAALPESNVVGNTRLRDYDETWTYLEITKLVTIPKAIVQKVKK